VSAVAQNNETPRDNEDRKRPDGRFRGLLEAAPDAIVIVRKDGCIAHPEVSGRERPDGLHVRRGLHHYGKGVP
jgi:PAS domain-containing protein